MHNILLIARREYLERVRTKAFIIATLLIPVLLGGIGFGGGYLSNTHNRRLNCSCSAMAPQAADLHPRPAGRVAGFPMRTASQARSTPVSGQTRRASESCWTATVEGQERHSYGLLAGAAAGTPVAGRASPTRRAPLPTSPPWARLRHAISLTLNREHLAHEGLSRTDIDNLIKPVEIDTSKTGDTIAAFGAAYALFFMMYFVIMQFGMNTARSIIEEKTSRVFEVMLATIKPDEMLAGKILGVGAVGLTQVGIWMAAAAGFGAYALATSGNSSHIYISPAQIGFFIAYFFFGFLIYSAIAAALGAMTNSEQELQQLNMFLVMPLALCMLMLGTMIKSPDSTLARIVSQIPFCAPLLMDFRISHGNPQAWEIVLSFVLMAAFIALVLWIASRIYRVGILMYGKKPNLPEILRWLKYS